jgi:hypothetical protein
VQTEGGDKLILNKNDTKTCPTRNSYRIMNIRSVPMIMKTKPVSECTDYCSFHNCSIPHVHRKADVQRTVWPF